MARLDAAVAKADAEPPCSDRLDLDLRRASASFDLDDDAGGEGLDVAATAFSRSHDSLLYAKGAAASRAGSLGAMPTDPESTVRPIPHYDDTVAARRFPLDAFGFHAALAVRDDDRDVIHAELRWPEAAGGLCLARPSEPAACTVRCGPPRAALARPLPALHRGFRPATVPDRCGAPPSSARSPPGPGTVTRRGSPTRTRRRSFVAPPCPLVPSAGHSGRWPTSSRSPSRSPRAWHPGSARGGRGAARGAGRAGLPSAVGVRPNAADGNRRGARSACGRRRSARPPLPGGASSPPRSP